LSNEIQKKRSKKMGNGRRMFGGANLEKSLSISAGGGATRVEENWANMKKKGCALKGGGGGRRTTRACERPEPKVEITICKE